MIQAANWRDLKGKRRRTKPWLDGLPRLIFVGDMADNFSSEVPFEFLRDEVVSAVTSEKGTRHEWLWLTKRPQQMAEFSTWLQKTGIPWPENLWAGTSITTQASTSRIAPLLNVGDHRTLRFLSVEPQWEQIDIKHWLHRLDWVIQGGMSGSHDHPFDLDWADDLRLQCYRAGRPYFLKQLGSCVFRDGQRVQVRRGHNGDWNLWPSDELKVRQMPLLAGVVGNRGLRQRFVDKA
jgi:protein gp37